MKKICIISEAVETAVLYFEVCPENLVRDIVKDFNLSYGAIDKILKNHSIHSL